MTVLVTTPARAAPQNLEEVQRHAEAFARSQTTGLAGSVSVETKPVDPRLHLPACDRLESFLPRGARLWGRSQVGVRCLGAEKWSVTLTVHVSVRGPAVYTARPLSRGVPLTTADLNVRETDLTQLPAGVLSDPVAALGRVPRVSLAAGLPLTGDLVRSDTVIQYGQTVTVLYEENGLRITSEGKALGPAGIGDALKVRSTSGKTVQGIVTGPAEVRVR